MQKIIWCLSFLLMAVGLHAHTQGWSRVSTVATHLQANVSADVANKTEETALITSPPQIKFNPKDGAEMIFIPPGPFLMGDYQYDNPRHTVTLSGYWIYKNDVTVSMYRKFCDKTGRKMPTAPPWGWKDEHPIVNVTWDDAKAYCEWAGVHLPTEAQWEKAARGIVGYKYPWGNDWDGSRLQCSKTIPRDANTTAPVGSFPLGASPYGCLDMAGNVWQWCADWYNKDYCKTDHGKDPAGPKTDHGIDAAATGSGYGRVLRGGSCFDGNTSSFLAAHRYYCAPDSYFDNRNGFRGSSGP